MLLLTYLNAPQNSASGRLSRLIFEGESGLFGGGGVGAAVAGIGGVKSVADMTMEVQKAEWFVGRAYSLLQEVRQPAASFYSVARPPPPLPRAHICSKIAAFFIVVAGISLPESGIPYLHIFVSGARHRS